MTKRPEESTSGRSAASTRRDLLKGALGSALLGGTLKGCAEPSSKPAAGPPPSTEPGPLPPDGLKTDDFLVHNTTPWNLETPPNVHETALITPTRRLYVRANLPLPPRSVLDDRDAWTFRVDGVAESREMTLVELRSLDLTSVACVLQCSGNGRFFSDHEPSGSPWRTGAAGHVIWTGASVRAVLDALGGANPEARFLTATGGEPIPDGLEERDVVVERSIPLQKGLDDAILAWEINGEPLPLIYGGPLRLVVPGYYGVNSVKYVKRLACTIDESDAKRQRSNYRLRPIGESGAATQPSMWRMDVKSWITTPRTALLRAGRVQISGVAFGGGSPIERVETSVDGGESWNTARLIGPDFGRFGWRRFVFSFDAEPGEYALASRAFDADGATQPMERIENQRGYANNAWRDHQVRIVVS